MDELCDFFPPEVASVCNYYVNTYGDLVIELLNKDLNVSLANLLFINQLIIIIIIIVALR